MSVNYRTGGGSITLPSQESSERSFSARTASVDDNYDFLFKVVLVGNSGVGKSNLLGRFTRNEFQTDFKTTIGVEFATKTLQVGTKRIKAQIWDTAGQEKFRVISHAYFRNSMGAILVYDITKQESFQQLDRWVKEVSSFAPEQCKMILVGNKIDLEHLRSVSQSDAADYARSLGAEHIETSALKATNVK